MLDQGLRRSAKFDVSDWDLTKSLYFSECSAGLCNQLRPRHKAWQITADTALRENKRIQFAKCDAGQYGGLINAKRRGPVFHSKSAIKHQVTESAVEVLNDLVERELATLPKDMQARFLRISELLEKFRLQ